MRLNLMAVSYSTLRQCEYVSDYVLYVMSILSLHVAVSQLVHEVVLTSH